MPALDPLSSAGEQLHDLQAASSKESSKIPHCSRHAVSLIPSTCSKTWLCLAHLCIVPHGFPATTTPPHFYLVRNVPRSEISQTAPEYRQQTSV
ncbi:hypothetical protein SRHO_G00114270 [Serrasalmus rhombeus]